MNPNIITLDNRECNLFGLVRLFAHPTTDFLTSNPVEFCPLHEPIYHEEYMEYLKYYVVFDNKVHLLTFTSLRQESEFCGMIKSGIDVKSAVEMLLL